MASSGRQLAVAVISVSLTIFGCTKKSSDTPTPNPERTYHQSVENRDQQTSNPQPFDSDQSQESNQVEQHASLPFVFSRSDLARYQIYADTLQAKLIYAGKTEEKDVVFNGDKGEVTFSRLPVGQTSDLKLDLYEGGTHKLTGTIANLVLKNGANRARIAMKQVEDGGNSETGDLILDLNIDTPNPPPNQGNDGSNPDRGGNDIDPTPTPNPTPTPTPEQGSLGVDLNNVTFADVKKHILDGYCISCHEVDSDMINMADYPFRSSYFRTQKQIVKRMIESTGEFDVRPMPPLPKPRLPANRRQILIKWYEQGIPE